MNETFNKNNDIDFDEIEKNISNYSAPELENLYAILEKLHQRKARNLRKLIDQEITKRVFKCMHETTFDLSLKAYSSVYNTNENVEEKLLAELENNGSLEKEKEFFKKYYELGVASGFLTKEDKVG